MDANIFGGLKFLISRQRRIYQFEDSTVWEIAGWHFRAVCYTSSSAPPQGRGGSWSCPASMLLSFLLQGQGCKGSDVAMVEHLQICPVDPPSAWLVSINRVLDRVWVLDLGCRHMTQLLESESLWHLFHSWFIPPSRLPTAGTDTSLSPRWHCTYDTTFHICIFQRVTSHWIPVIYDRVGLCCVSCPPLLHSKVNCACAIQLHLWSYLLVLFQCYPFSREPFCWPWI